MPRPGRHKLDTTLRDFIDPTVERRDAPIPPSAFSDRGNMGPDEAKLAQYISIRTLVVTLISPRTHSRAAPSSLESPAVGFSEVPKHFGISAEDFVALCETEFDRRGWGSTASVVSEVRVAVHLDASTLLGGEQRTPHNRRGGEAAGGELESVKSVARWLSSRWEVLWLEPKQMFRPTVRYASKMLTTPAGHPNYKSDVMRRATINALNNPLNTGSMDVVSLGGAATGKFCMHLNDTHKTMQLFLGSNGTHTSFLNPVATAVIRVPLMRTPLHEDGFNRSVGLLLVSMTSSPLHSVDDYFVGMQLELATEKDQKQGEGAEEVIDPNDCYPWPLEARGREGKLAFSQLARPRGCPRMITSYSAATGRVSIYPPWKTVKNKYLDGLLVRIRPLMMPGQRVTVLADSHVWKSIITLDWLKDMLSAEDSYRKAAILTSQLDCALLPDGSAKNRVPEQESLATFLMDHGYVALQTSCSAGVQQLGEITASKQLLGFASNTPCPVLCRDNKAVLELESKMGVCVYNQSHIVSVDHNLGALICKCRYESQVLLKVEFKIPDANPLWDYGLNGSGQIIGMADTGLDHSNCLLSESDIGANLEANSGGKFVRPVDVSRDSKFGYDSERRKVAGYQLISPDDCALCDTCAKIIKWDKVVLFGETAKIQSETFKAPFPHRCGESTIQPKLRSQRCCGFSCGTAAPLGRVCLNPASPCGQCTCKTDVLGEKICLTDKGEDCDEDDCKPCCHACSHDARLNPRRYDVFGAELAVHISGRSKPPFDFPVAFRLFVFTREDYERHKFSKALYIVDLYSTCIRALMFEYLCQVRHLV